jgi:hypothetical protein
MDRFEYKQSNSSSADVERIEKVKEWFKLLELKISGLQSTEKFEDVFRKIDEYEKYLLSFSNRKLIDSKIFEIGYGARPYLLVGLNSMGCDACGVDLDQPVLHGKFNELIAIYRKNGLERLLKSIIRFYCFDWYERKLFRQALASKGYPLVISSNNFWVGDASTDAISNQLEENSVDLIISEDVFEHIPQESLQQLVARMARWLKRDGVALIRPFIYTGISGSHLPEWYPYTLETKDFRRSSEPWEHLRKKRFHANTYLNQMSLLDYRSLFESYFEVLEQKVMMPSLGREFLTDDVRQDLKDFSEDELFSNSVLFVLKCKQD